VAADGSIMNNAADAKVGTALSETVIDINKQIKFIASL